MQRYMASFSNDGVRLRVVKRGRFFASSSVKDAGVAPDEMVQPFYLEDDSGRILIDPRGATIQPAWQPNLELGTREIALTRRVEPVTMTCPEIRSLFPGDPVYVIGNVQERPDASADAVGSDRLMVKPLEPSPIAGSFPWKRRLVSARLAAVCALCAGADRRPNIEAEGCSVPPRGTWWFALPTADCCTDHPNRARRAPQDRGGFDRKH